MTMSLIALPSNLARVHLRRALLASVALGGGLAAFASGQSLGSIVAVGFNGSGQLTVPSLPPMVTYLEIAGGE